ncbi:MAG: cytochrome P450 [Actinophytocola sp.]|uniref:cytochrome P450 n=1 Tax=Actinophytocola sp. TaxID=1872138 RepID=UPI003C7728D2
MTDTTPLDQELIEYPTTRECPFDPPPETARLRQECPVALSRVAATDGEAWLLTRWEDVRTMLSDPRVSSDFTHPNYPRILPVKPNPDMRPFVFMDPPEHTRVRRGLNRDFMVKRINALRPKVQEIVDELIDRMLAGPRPVDFVTAFALPVPSQMMCLLLGVPYEDHEFFESNSNALFNLSRPEEANAARLKLIGYLDKLVTAKEEEPTDDMLGHLVESHIRTGQMTHGELLSVALSMLLAGHETTTGMISLGTLVLLRHPEQLAELRQDPSLLDNAIEELLRYLSINQTGVRRIAKEDIEFSGQLVRAGEALIGQLASANRDESVFPDADRFDIHRDTRKMMAFGTGVHQCIGQNLARVELQVVFSTLFERIPTLRIAVPFEELKFRYEMAVYGMHEMPVAW